MEGAQEGNGVDMIKKYYNMYKNARMTPIIIYNIY